MAGIGHELNFEKDDSDRKTVLPAAPEPIILRLEPVIRMTQSCYVEIMGELANRPPEAGGMLLGPADDDLVTHYIPDVNAKATAASFTLDAAGLNKVLAQFRECGMNAKGLVHSHPRGCVSPSVGDIEYVRKSLANAKNQAASRFLLPIVCGKHLYPYIITRGERDEAVIALLLLV